MHRPGMSSVWFFGFWPFVRFNTPNFYFNYDHWKTKGKFGGIFCEYDWSEFCVYVIGAIIIYIIIKILSKSGEKYFN